MKLFDTPYIQRAVADERFRAEFVERFVRLSNSDSDKAADLMARMIDQFERIANDKTKEFELIDAMGEDASSSHNKLAWLVYKLKFQRALSTRRLSTLRQIVEEVDCADDEDDCMEYLGGEYDISRCDDCNEWEFSGKMGRTWNDDSICRECIDNSYQYASRYEAHVPCDDYREALDEEGDIVGISCEDDNFHWDDDEDRYVHNDYEPQEPSIIQNYHSSKGSHYPVGDAWSISKQRWFGVELEVELNREKGHYDREEKAERLHQALNKGERGHRVFFENDGSLNAGFEIVSQPMSLPMHREFWTWLKQPELVRGLLSHNTSTCGLHVHVTKQPLSKLQIAKMVAFVNHEANRPLITAVARRYAEGYCKIKDKKIGTAHYSEDRYEAVNVTSRKTVEFRIFKGSLKYESVIAAIEFVNALVEFTAPCHEGSITSLNADAFLDFVNTKLADETASLRPYLANRLETA